MGFSCEGFVYSDLLKSKIKENTMNFTGIKNSFIFKTISITLIVAFSLYNTSYATAEKDALAPSVLSTEAPLSVEDIGIAIDAGTIKSKFSGDTGKVIVHIQDAHCNFEAQSNINKMLDQLTKECGINLISVEGAEGLVDTAWFKAFPDAEIRKEVATYFMKKGEITGAEFFSINSDYSGTIFGAETKDYYVKNLKAFTEVYPYKTSIENYFNNLRSISGRLKLIVYPPKLRELDSKMKAFSDKELELSEYAGYLYNSAVMNKINTSSYPNLKKLMETLEYEEKINFDIVDTERTNYIDSLAKKLSKEDMTNLVTQSIRFKKGHIKAVDFYSFLRDLAKEHKIPMLQEYPNLFYYYIYTKIYDGIDNEGLFREMDLVERALKEKLFTDDVQRKLDKDSELVDLFIDLANIELTNEDYDLFQKYSDEFSVEDIVGFFGSLVDKYNLNYSMGSVPEEISQNIPKMIAFYEVAMKRDKAIIDNTLNQMSAEGSNRCVLIAGGFHTRGIKNLLEQKGISYVVVTPKITKDAETPYIKVLTNQRTSLEDIITESAAIPGAEMSTSKEKITEGVSDLLAPVLRTAINTDFGSISREPQEKFAEDWTEGNTVMWIEKVHDNLVAQLGMTQDQADAEFLKFIQDDELWDMLLAVYAGKYADNAKKQNRELDDATRKLIRDKFTEYRNEVRQKSGLDGQQPATPGEQDAGGRILTSEEHANFNEVVKKKFAEREKMTDQERAAHEVKMDHIRKGFIFQKHDGFVEALAEVGLPANVHPSRGGVAFGHRLLQANIDSAIYDSLTQEELDTLARHELAHIDIANENKRSRAWQLWVKAGKPVGDDQEDFVNNTLGYDVTAIANKIKVIAEERERVMRAKYGNVDDLEAIVENNEGPREVIAITNGGDGQIVEGNFTNLKDAIFRKDGTTTFMAHEELTRRGQFLGLLDAMKAWKEKNGDFDKDGVSLGIMMPGKGTRLSPLTLSLYGIKPFITMLIKAKNKILSGATASLYTWNLVANNLKRMGFRGIAWKWGDEPQIAANRLSELKMDLTRTDIVRFGSKVLVTDDLAENKEWLSATEDGTLGAQVRRRGRADLLKALGVEDTPEAKAMVHIGSPAFSYDFIDAAIEAFDGVPQESWLDVDGYLIEALTLKRDGDLTAEEKARGIRTWDSEYREELRKEAEEKKASGMKEALKNVPDLYERAQNLKRILNEKRGKPADAPLNIKVIDFGEKLAWYDVGQLSKARESFYGVNRDTPEGEFARRFAGMKDAVIDEFGNRIVGDSYYPKDGSVRNSTIINTRIFGSRVLVNGAVLVDCDLGNVIAGKESVAYGSTVSNLEMGERSFSFKSVEENLNVPTDAVHTSMPANPLDLNEIKEQGIESWRALTVDEQGKDLDVGKGAYYNEAAFGNKRSFNEQRERMRTRSEELSIEDVERTIDTYVRNPILEKIVERAADLKAYFIAMFEPLKFGTSGLRDTVDHYEAGEFLRGKMTDMEVYINTKGFINFLREIGDIDDTHKTIAVGGDLRSSTRRIQEAVIKAIVDEGLEADFIGDVPSPTLAYYAMEKGMPSVMVTGSHIPEDRNGIKYTKVSGEVLKSDEKPILNNVAKVREQEYNKAGKPEFQFDLVGKFKEKVVAPPAVNHAAAVDLFVQRYVRGLPSDFLQGRRVVIYQHSAVGRDIAAEIFIELGAEVIIPKETVEVTYIDEATGQEKTEKVSLRSDTFVPVDTEKITNKTQAVLNYLRDNYEADAYVSFDGDTDRPLFTDENANFLPGDKLGALSAQFLKPDMVAIPVSANRKMVEDDLIGKAGIDVKKTKVGSPYVIARVEKYLSQPGNENKRAVTWESNGGFLLMTPVKLEGAQQTLKPLPTRDAILPLILAVQQSGEYGKASEMIKQRLTPYETNAGVVDNKTPGAETYTAEMGQTIKNMFTPRDTNIAEVKFSLIGSEITAVDMDEEPYEISQESKDEILKIRRELKKYFTQNIGFTAPISAINFMDGVQIVFDDGKTYEVSHLRPSSNAPEFRNYALGANIDKAREIAERRYKIVPSIIKGLESETLEGAEKETDIVKMTPGIYSATSYDNELVRSEVIRVPLVKGPVIPGTTEREYTVSVVLAEDEKGEATTYYEIETFGNTDISIPEIIGESLKGRQVQLRVTEGAIGFDEETLKPNDVYVLSVKEDYQDYRIRNINGGQRAVMIIDQEDTQRERIVTEILNLVRKHVSAIKEQRITVYVPSEMFYKGDDVGSFEWTKEIIKALAGDKIQLKKYNASGGLAELGGMGLDTSEDMVNVLIAADSQLQDTSEFVNKDVKDFVENVRPLPVPRKALNLNNENEWGENGWDFSLETVGWALILGAVNPQQIIDLRDKKDETSPAADMVKFMERVLKKKLESDYLFAMMPYSVRLNILGDVTDKEVQDILSSENIMSWLNFLVSKFLFDMPIEPFDPADQLRQRMKVMWSV